VVEYIGQTRGWFYNLHVLAVALFDRPAFSTCLAHGVILGDDGQKMSKRLRNYPDPEEMFAKHGADAMRWALLSSPVVRGGDTIFTEKAITDAVRAALLPLWNAWYFFSLYANADGYAAPIGRTDAPGVLDRYVLAKAHQAIVAVSAAMDAYDIPGACAAVESFLDALTNWYIRRSRDRFWGTGSTDGEGSTDGAGSKDGAGSRDTADAFDTLATVLDVLCRLAAPLLPLETEAVWRGLVSDPDVTSVHLTDWPDPGALPADDVLVARMDRIRDVCSAGHSIRKAAGRRARLPLASLTVVASDAADLEPFASIVADEVNVKTVRFRTDVDRYASRRLTVVFRVAAPRLGKDTQAVAAAAKVGDWTLLSDGRARVGPATLEPPEFELRLNAVSEETTRTLPGLGGLVVLDVDTDATLEAEGIARDVVRAVQQRRRELGLAISDRIELTLVAPAPVASAIEAHRPWIASQTLAISLTISETGEPGPTDPAAVTLADGAAVTIQIRRA
jgi:isoleucyl-tRNA synthetase